MATSSFTNFFKEARRRRVFRVAALYVIGAWVALQVADLAFPGVGIPESAIRYIWIGAILGFPIALVVGWLYDIVGGRIVRTKEEDSEIDLSLRRADYLILSALVVVVASITVGLIAEISGTQRTKTILQTDELGNNTSVRMVTVELPRSMRITGNRYRPVIISADGQRLIFGVSVEGQINLYSRPLGSLDVLEIKGAKNVSPTFALSPDGEWIAFQERTNGMLKKIPANGGIPVTLCDPGGYVRNISWGENDSIVFVRAGFAGLMQVSSVGGEPQQLTKPPDGEYHKQPDISPTGRAVFFTIGEPGRTMRRADRIAVLSLDTDEQKTLLAGASPRATPTGHLIYYSENALRVVAFDADRLEVTSESIAVADGVLYDLNAVYSISDEDTLVYVLTTELAQRSLVWVDRFGNEEEVAIDRRPYMSPRVSPNGEQLAFVIDAENAADLWTYSFDRGTSTQLTFDESHEVTPAWSPDGRHIVFSSNRVDDLFMVASDGVGPIEQLTDTSTYQYAVSFLPSGDSVFFNEEGGRFKGISVLSISDKSVSRVLETGFHPVYPQLSPDGRWLAYHSNRSGENEVYVRPYPDVDSAVWQVSVDYGIHPLWSEDSKELFYWGQSDMMSVKIKTTPAFQAERPKPLFGHGDYIDDIDRFFDLDRTNDRFLMVKKPPEDEIPTNRIIIVQNWLDDVARRIATN